MTTTTHGRLSDRAKELLDAPTFATLSTLNEDGSPQATVHWVTRDGDDILMSTVQGRRHERNLRRDPRVSVLVVDPENPYHYLEVRGTATLSEQRGRELIDELSEKYLGRRPYANDGPDAVRVVIRIPAERVIEK